jgi:hypothetical protein
VGAEEGSTGHFKEIGFNLKMDERGRNKIDGAGLETDEKDSGYRIR